MTPPEAHAHSLISLASHLWLNVFFWSVMPLLTVVFLVGATVYVCIFFLIFRSRRRTKWLIRRTISNYGLAFLRCGWPLVRVRYVDYAPRESPPFVFIANHRSASDMFLMACLPFECVAVANNWPYDLPVVGLAARISGYLKIREMSFDAFMEAGSRLLAAGVSVIAFPEGTRSGSRRLGPFHGSAFRLAQRVGVSIVPLAISGNENIPPRGSLVLHPGRIVVSKLPAVTPDQFKDMTAFKLKNLVRERIRQHLDAQPA
jgi:1-acyl-sn-glycerol-3-phosphate acyltransferase